MNIECKSPVPADDFQFDIQFTEERWELEGYLDVLKAESDVSNMVQMPTISSEHFPSKGVIGQQPTKTTLSTNIMVEMD